MVEQPRHEIYRRFRAKKLLTDPLFDRNKNDKRSLANKVKREAAQTALAGRPKPLLCEVCGTTPEASRWKSLVFDHDHSTGRFRGWLCHGCNVALGMTKDQPHVLRALARYLEIGI